MKLSFLEHRPRGIARLVSLCLALLIAVIARHFASDGVALVAANAFVFTDWLTMEGLRLLKNKLQVGQFFDTSYNKEFTQDFAVGDTVRVKLPNRGFIRDGLGYAPQPIQRIYTTVACDQIFGYDFEWDSAEKALKMERGEDQIKKEYLEPAMAQIAQEIDSRAALWAYQNANNVVGVLGTDPTSTTTHMQARQRLIELGCPPSGDKGYLIPPQYATSLVPAVQSLFQPGSDIARQYKEGTLGRLGGFDWYESMSLYDHTAGTWAGAVTVSGAGQSGSSLNVACTTGDTFNKGDVFSMASVFPTNPMTRRKTNSATTKQFVITTATVGAASAATLSISPAIFGPGSPYQNVDALPANAAALTLFPGTSSPSGKAGKQALAIHPQAFALVGVKLETPKAVEMASQTRDPETGISVRFVRAWDQQQSKMTNRFDVLLGFGNLYPDNCAVRVLCA